MTLSRVGASREDDAFGVYRLILFILRPFATGFFVIIVWLCLKKSMGLVYPDEENRVRTLIINSR